MRRRGLFLTLIVLWYIFGSVLSLVYPLSLYGLLAALFRKLNNFNLTLIVGTSARRRPFTNSSQTNSPRSTSKIAEKNKHVIHRPRSVRIGKNRALGLEYGPRPAALGRTQDLGHSSSLYRPPGRWITYIYCRGRILGNVWAFNKLKFCKGYWEIVNISALYLQLNFLC